MNFLFIHIHKCAGTSIKSSLSKIKNTHYLEKQKADFLKYEISEKYRDFKKFTFIRNPYSRFLSSFKMFKRRYPDITTEKIFKIIENDNIPYSYEFFRNKNSYIKRHTLPMTSEYYSIYDNHGNCNVDLILRFENFEEEIKKLSLFLGEKIIIPKLNTSKNEKLVLTMEDKIKINEIYKKDFEVFKYEMEYT